MKRLLTNDAFRFLFFSLGIALLVYAVDAMKGRIVVRTVYVTFFDVLDIIVAVSVFIGLFQV
jgi:hypothetical protein